ncbi:hypothetical protein VNO78_02620 [Psophocarpus tetragonolobus]|uniref:Uncharacterized protein n=1 Tax=Psophocarpus tetragonolobus TaxID=3891 RepID=A0AAN9T060_PSOTE
MEKVSQTLGDLVRETFFMCEKDVSRRHDSMLFKHGHQEEHESGKWILGLGPLLECEGKVHVENTHWEECVKEMWAVTNQQDFLKVG